MLDLRRLEQCILSKQVLEAEIDNLLSEGNENDMMLSVHILNARKLPMSLTSKVQRQLKFCLDEQIYETRVVECEGTAQTAKWNESHLLPVNSIDSCLKIVYIEKETSAKPLGGVIIRVSGLIDQKRHDGWYEIGCGEVRLALRFIHNSRSFYSGLLETLSSSIQATGNTIEKKENLQNEDKIEKFYSGLIKINTLALVAEAKKIRKTMENSAVKIQKKFKKWCRVKAEFALEIKYFLSEKIDFLIRTLEEKSLEKSFSIDSNVPPYIEAVEKVCKRRIPIKRY